MNLTFPYCAYSTHRYLTSCDVLGLTLVIMASLPQSDAVSINDLVTLSLLKFSHATTSSPKGKVLWHHVTQSDNKLFAVVDQVTFKNDKGLIVREKILKVVHGGLVIVSHVVKAS